MTRPVPEYSIPELGSPPTWQTFKLSFGKPGALPGQHSPTTGAAKYFYPTGNGVEFLRTGFVLAFRENDSAALNEQLVGLVAGRANNHGETSWVILNG